MLDLVVIGGGFAGLVAANRAAELGCSVALLEAQDGAYLCNSRIATGAMNFAHSDPQLPPEMLVRSIEADTENHADPALANAIAQVAGRGLQWLMDNGADFIRKDMQGKISWVLAPPRVLAPGLDWKGKGSDLFLDELARRLEGRGGQFRRGVRARKLVIVEGRVAGVEAETKEGPLRLDARNVLIADGGFQASEDLVARHICKSPEKLVQRNAGAGFGDGIRMASEAGARLRDMNRFYGHVQSRDALTNDRLWPYPTMDSLSGGGIVIGAAGVRLFDEGSGGVTMANYISELDDPTSAWALFDDEIWNTTGKDEVVPANPDYVEAGGTLLSAPSIAELAPRMGVPASALVASVEVYNAAVTSGRETSLDPPRTPGRRFGVLRSADVRIPVCPIVKAPFYAIPLAAGISFTMGGLAIDVRGRVQREAGGLIDGLYAAGDSSAGLMGGPIAGYIGGLATAYCTALIAAESIAHESRDRTEKAS
jgi:fumarate reductase flavoprotein subunit